MYTELKSAAPPVAVCLPLMSFLCPLRDFLARYEGRGYCWTFCSATVCVLGPGLQITAKTRNAFPPVGFRKLEREREE